MADLSTQQETAQVLREGARLLYTVAAGQFFQLGDINAWFGRYNDLVRASANESDPALQLGDPYGEIAQRQSEADPLIARAQSILEDLAARATAGRDDFTEAAAAAAQSGGS